MTERNRVIFLALLALTGPAGGPHAAGYQRRTAGWWPRRGVDVIEVEKGMVARTWTLRDPLDPAGKAENSARRLPSAAPRQFKAHLIGFRGFGNHMGNPFRGPKPVTPAVVLRLADGRKRCFVRGSFSDADERFIMELYVREMNRIRSTLDAARHEHERKITKIDGDEITVDVPLYNPIAAAFGGGHRTDRALAGLRRSLAGLGPRPLGAPRPGPSQRGRTSGQLTRRSRSNARGKRTGGAVS